MNLDKDLIEEDVYSVFASTAMDYPDVFLAGGYLRDRCLGVTPKDVDLWTWKPFLEGRVPTADSETSGAMGAGRIQGVECIVDIGDIQAFEAGLIKVDPLCKYPVELIHALPEPATTYGLVSTFCFGICQIAYDPNWDKILYTEAFMKDLGQKTFTVCRTADADEAMNIYLKFLKLRGSKKFPGWKMVIPKKWLELYMKIEGFVLTDQIVAEGF